GGMVSLGLNDPESDDLTALPAVPYGWDNEKPEIMRTVEPFQIQHRPVTIGEYVSFLQAVDWAPELIPSSWIRDGSEWKARSIFGPIPFSVSGSWPVSSSHFQATAYAQHYGWTLASEEELVHVRSVTPESLSDNHSFTSFHPRPVCPSSNVVTALTGDGWELTSTVFSPFDGFEASEMYPGYSSDFL
ncbi:hypothetical protein HDU91_002522, partial [Kappamyces sp. JEL0680]